MKITDIILNDKYTISFEVFPPKNDTLVASVEKATEEIAALSPAYVSVTYGAGGGTSEYTVNIAKNINDKYGVPVLTHLTCVSSTKETVRTQIERMHKAGIKNVLALRGDLTEELKDSDRSGLDYKFATDLIEEIKASPYDFSIGGACYPEIHPESENQKEDIKHLKEKVDAGCDFLTTQMFFDNNLFFNFLYKIREAGIFVPIVPGIMPITRGNQVKRAIELSGSFMPQRFLSLVDRFGSDADAMEQAGIIYTTDQIIDLFANGIRHVHVYSMNNPKVAERIMENLSSILGKE